jgi:hypothetical protein
LEDIGALRKTSDVGIVVADAELEIAMKVYKQRRRIKQILFIHSISSF